MLLPIPAIDIIEGKCVRLSQGAYDSKKVYDASPLDLALQFQDLGFKRLHLVDLDGAKSQHVVNMPVLEQITSKTSLEVDFGGGIKANEDLEKVFNAGAQFATIGSLAVKEPEKFETWIEQYGAERIILGADVKDGFISINGWKENSDYKLLDFLKYYTDKGISQVLCTDISKDGMLKGTSVQLYKEIMQAFPQLFLIASGGVSGINDLDDLNQAQIPAVVFGKAIYEGRINLQEVANKYLTSNTL